jgi:cytidylate kinase
MQNIRYNNKPLKISCDGGASTGKSTGAKMISKKYKLKFLSSGLLYRYASFLVLKFKPKNKVYLIKKKFRNFDLNSLSRLNLHTQEISENSAKIAKIKSIRDVLKKIQVNFSKKNIRCCIEGRDISTKIMPDSDLKFYFKCNLNKASIRRYNELKSNDNKIKLKDVKRALRLRNSSDTRRKHSPLLKHRNSIIIDTGKMNKTSMLHKMSIHIDKFLDKKYGR